MILGIAGPYGSGKSAVVSFLAEASFVPLSLSDVLREELATRGLEETRERMIELGNELRRAEGADALARRLASRISSDRNYVVDSIRHPAEVLSLRELAKDFRLLWISEGAPETPAIAISSRTSKVVRSAALTRTASSLTQ
jgi:dephospho-CoA kinase